MFEEKLISIHLNSNRPESFENFVKSIISTTKIIKKIEILVNIDKGDKEMIQIITKLNKQTPDLIKYIETDLIKTFADAWKPLNLLLKQTSKTCYFVCCVSDEIRFLTKNWDDIILKYRKYFEDDIFRIRCSKYKNEEYNDIWECGYKPDSYAFYTKKWLDQVNLWNPCIGPDSFQECVAYYIKKYGAEYNRDVINNKINYSGQNVSDNLKLFIRIQRTRIYYKAFFRLMSYRIQKIANEKAYEIVCCISKNENVKKKKLNSIKIIMTNFYRRFNFFYHRGSPNHVIDSKLKNIIFMLWCYMEFLDKFLIKTLLFMSKKSVFQKVFKDKDKIQQIEKILNE